MSFDFTFIFTSISLGVGLAMDAFSVSLANGLNEPRMNGGRMSLIAGVFAVFQFLMPMIGVILLPTASRQAVIVQMLCTMIVIPVWTIWLQKSTGIPALLVGLIGAPLVFFAVNALYKKTELSPEISALWEKFRQL